MRIILMYSETDAYSLVAQGIKVLSSDLNGTLVLQQTMSDLVRIHQDDASYQLAAGILKLRQEGKASISDVLSKVAQLTRGVTLRQAIAYTTNHMQYTNGFAEFAAALAASDVKLIINTTGYTVTACAIQEQIGKDIIHGYIANHLRFGVKGDENETLREDELETKVRKYFTDPHSREDSSYDRIQATGAIDFAIPDEARKLRLLGAYLSSYLPEVYPHEVAHMGDTRGDGEAIVGVAAQGGVGILFNYDETLYRYITAAIQEQPVPGKIYFMTPKSQAADLREVPPALARDFVPYRNKSTL